MALGAERCNCSLNNRLSGVASLSFGGGLHSVLSCSQASQTRTVAFLRLPGKLHQPHHQGLITRDFSLQVIYSPDVKQACVLNTYRDRETRGVPLMQKVEELDGTFLQRSADKLNTYKVLQASALSHWSDTSRPAGQLCFQHTLGFGYIVSNSL